MTTLETPPPTPQDQQMAREAEARLRRLLDAGEAPRALLHVEGSDQVEIVVLPLSTLRLLDEILEANANGQGVMVLPANAELTPNQAAELLGVSRPFLVKLLDEGRIPFRRVGAHRRVRLDALQRYRLAEEERQLQVLAKLQEQAQELNMGY